MAVVFLYESGRLIESNSAIETTKVTAAMIKSTTKAYVGKARGSNKAGNIGKTLKIPPNGWFAL